jgi:hypothetical protein
MTGELGKAFAEERKAHINSLADKIEEFYKDFAPSNRNTRMILPTFVVGFPMVRDRDLVGALVYELSKRNAPLNNYIYEGKIVAESSYTGNTNLETPVYKLKVDVVPRPEGGHHC